MKTQLLGSTDIQVTRLSYGAMRIAGGWDKNKVTKDDIERGIASLESAVEAGYNFIDHADIYGDTMCEVIHGLALDRHPDWRDKLVVATKCGIRFDDEPPGTPHRYDLSGEHIRWSVNESLKRLKLERIDLYQLHRPDWLADPAEIASALVDIHRAGKVRYFGMSNSKPSLVSAIQSALPFPLVSNQVEIHLLRLDCFEDGTLDQCLEKKMTPMAWSPLGWGRIAAAFDDKVPLPQSDRDLAVVSRLRPLLKDVAQAYSTTPLAIVLAWLMRHPSKIIPIYGSTRPEMIRAATEADKVDLDRDNWYRILFAARGKKLE
jgi:predicted oxidoreductase